MVGLGATSVERRGVGPAARYGSSGAGTASSETGRRGWPWGPSGEPDHGAVDVDADRAVGAGLPVAGSTPVSRSGRVAARLKTCTSSIWRLLRPCLTALSVQRPSWASHSGLYACAWRGSSRREVAEHVEQVAAVAERVDQRGVAGARVLGGMAVLDQVDEALRLRVVVAGLTVDEAEQALAGGAEEVVAAVVGGLVERGDVGRALEHRGERLAGVGRDVDDRLAGVEALHEQQVDPRLGVLARARSRRCGRRARGHPCSCGGRRRTDRRRSRRSARCTPSASPRSG